MKIDYVLKEQLLLVILLEHMLWVLRVKLQIKK